MVFFCFRCKFLNFYSLNSILVVTNLVQSFVLNQRWLMEWRGYYIRNLGCYYATGGCVPASRILVLGMDDVRSCDYDLEVQLLWCMYSSCLEPHEVVCYLIRKKYFMFHIAVQISGRMKKMEWKWETEWQLPASSVSPVKVRLSCYVSATLATGKILQWLAYAEVATCLHRNNSTPCLWWRMLDWISSIVSVLCVCILFLFWLVPWQGRLMESTLSFGSHVPFCFRPNSYLVMW
jgi:hypothetical protein